ncbi:MAG: hypothetical protein BGO49_15430 [Planctomycetales bacterium 71-10]|nr:MAG: hypothetical protein BGO49_15430 [Planctomycetales bacterium 71-10]
MAKSSYPRGADYRSIYNLIGECRELGDDPRLWREHLLAWAARTAGAPVANEYEALLRPTVISGVTGWGWGGSGLEIDYWLKLNEIFARRGLDYNPMIPAYIAATERGEGPCLSRPDMVSDADWYGTEYFQSYHGPSRADVMMYSIIPQPNGMNMGVVLVRPIGDRDFSKRSKVVVGMAHLLIAPLVGGALAGYSDPSPSDLSPRTRQVLRCALEGDSDKQIAARLGMARNTVNHYVKQIYAHFHVQSRPELLARWLRHGWGSRFAWADPDAEA